MTLYNDAIPFEPSTVQNKNTMSNEARSIARSLTKADAELFTAMVSEWHNAPTLNACLSSWSHWQKEEKGSPLDSLQVLGFNVRGLDYRWGEVALLCSQYRMDIVVLAEVGKYDGNLLAAAMPNFQCFYQPGENKNGGVVILIRSGLVASRCPCSIPNVCIVDLQLEETVRIIGIYAPESKTWGWADLTKFKVPSCMYIGDFNVDLEEDRAKSDQLMTWADDTGVWPVVPDGPTSLRSNRTIDYALVAGLHVTLQTHQGDTTSDHRPIIGVIWCDAKELSSAKRTNWIAFEALMSYLFPFWERQWAMASYNETYNAFVDFLVRLAARCTTCIPPNMARPGLPYWLRSMLARSRSLHLKARRTGDVALRIEAATMRKTARAQLKALRTEQLNKMLADRHQSGEAASPFWRKSKKHFQNKSAALKAFVGPSGNIIKAPLEMAEHAADYYEDLFKQPTVFRPHPYVDSQCSPGINDDEMIPLVTYQEVIKVMKAKKKKSSCDAHGMSPKLLAQIPNHYWHLLIPLFNASLSTTFMPDKWKDVRMVVLAKKESICPPEATRPISLLDSIFKIQERLFLSRFLAVVNARGLLPDNQSGFRSNHRLQSRVLLLVEQISSLMANSSPVCTVFVDFKSAFDQLWFEGCVGKLARMGIPAAYVAWIKSWLYDRRGYIDMQGHRSRWFPIRRGGPQGSSLTPSIFITYHADLSDAVPTAMSFLFADDMAATIAGQMGIRYTDQCIDLERRLTKFFADLEYYATLAVQPINYSKTQAMWSARAIGYPNPMPVLKCGDNVIAWTKQYKYLGYWITTKLGWSTMINAAAAKIRQRTALVNSCKFSGASSSGVRRVLFDTFIAPLFTWLFALLPLFTAKQQNDLSHGYLTCLRRVYRCLYWENFLFTVLYNECTLETRCSQYWDKYCIALSKSEDGQLLLEQVEICALRQHWLDGNSRISALHRNKRLVDRVSVLAQCLEWHVRNQTDDSVPDINVEELEILARFPETF